MQARVAASWEAMFRMPYLLCPDCTVVHDSVMACAEHSRGLR